MSTLLLLKITLGPIMVALAYFLGRTKGHGIGGRLIGLPITTGPFILIVSLQEGSSFGKAAAHGVILGQIALASYCWIYTYISPKMHWLPALLVATISVLTVGFVTTESTLSTTQALVILTLLWLLEMRFWPNVSLNKIFTENPPWELPARIIVTLVIFIGLSALAPHLGAKISGALSTYPVIASVIAAFNHKRYGPQATMATLRGLMESFPLTIVFIALLAYLL